ncbi:hypothetical protein PCCS19_54120 [Paenibacillus sp. CCS19]|uniref:pre-peptidase C-terminal domain-containing protein n=1 Tax=Paenibacillus sp. CCS19 TaxID=3158387 RepID=UPI00256B0C3B|nr:pre-peptidase C-terminal domain-containing protein [Paenibacillus cellulosilyticus]GMK42353.1 hypothetical protein PCCS19_54120 [Paenibacillus cellulosilyticus]
MKKGLLLLFIAVLLSVALPAPASHAEGNQSIASGDLINGFSTSKDDTKTYSFFTAGDGEVRVELDGTTAGFSMYLYDANGNSLGGDYYSSRGNQIVIDKTLQQGYYTIEVAPYYWSGVSYGTYTLKATYTTAVTQNAQTFEPNNTFGTSYPIKSGLFYSSSSDSSLDVDSYQFTTKQDGEVNIALEKTSAGFSMYLYDEQGNSLGGDYYSSSGSNIAITKRLVAGTYYVKVAPYSWSSSTAGTYRLRATYAGDFERNAATYEPNETVETSYPIQSGIFYKSTSESVLDADVYQFTTDKDGEVNLALEKTTAGYSMYLYNQDGSNLGGDYYSSGGRSINIIKQLAAGTYYVRIAPYSWSGSTSGSYQLRATYAGSFTRNAKTFEPNETPETSYTIASGVSYASNADSALDLDMYSFTTSKDGEVRIELDGTTAGFSMYLYNENGSSLGGDYYSSSGHSIVIDTQVTKGKYYVRVIPYYWDGVTTGSYRIKATYPGTTKVDANTFEPNNTFETGFKIASGLFYSSKADSAIDQEVYQFTTAKDGHVDITLDKTSAGFSMYVYDANGSSVGGDYYSSSGYTIRYSNDLKKGTYYIKVNPYYWSGVTYGTYRLTAQYPVFKTVAINGKSQTFQYQVTSGVVQVPAKDVALKLGAKVSYDEKKKTMTLTKGSIKVVLVSGQTTANVNGKKITLSSKITASTSNLIVPATLFRDAFKATVEVNHAANTLNINLK